MSLDRQPGVGDRLQAGVDGQRERVDHQPPAEGGTADAAEDGPVLEALVAEGGAGQRPHRFGDPVHRVDRRPSARTAAATRPPVGGTWTVTSWPISTSPGVAAHDVRRQVDAGVLGQRDIGDHVRRIEVGEPPVLVDREAHDRAPARHRGRLPRPAPAVRTDGHRRVDQLAAVPALLDAERAVGARGPEPVVGRGQLGERACRHGLLPGRRALVRY